MTYLEYKQNLSDIRYLLNLDNGVITKGTFGTYYTNRDWYCIWSMQTKNVVLAYHPAKRLIRIRENSPYADALTRISYTVVKSKSLGKYRSERGDIDSKIYIDYISRPQIDRINKLTRQTEMILDFGPRRTRRSSIQRKIYYAVSGISNKNAIAEIIATSSTRRYTAILGPVAAPEQVRGRTTAQAQVDDARRAAGQSPMEWPTIRMPNVTTLAGTQEQLNRIYNENADQIRTELIYGRQPVVVQQQYATYDTTQSNQIAAALTEEVMADTMSQLIAEESAASFQQAVNIRARSVHGDIEEINEQDIARL